MALSIASATVPAAGSASQPGMTATVKHLAGMLWYEMLSELNKSGPDPSTLGAGSGSFQDMFLWSVAQNDFSKYDSALTSATLRQIGGHAGGATATASAAPAPAAPITSSPVTAATAPDGTAAGAATVQQATNFAKTVWPDIVSAAKQLNVPPVAVLAQTALETGWGVAAAGNNLFGIKATDGQSGSVRATHEMVDGVLTPQAASFRDYGSTADSVSDYVGQIQSAFQNVVGQSSVGGFASALQSGGYATDTSYAAKIVAISQSPLMQQVLQSVEAQPDGGANQ
jgi:flagellar protein FlgJ